MKAYKNYHNACIDLVEEFCNRYFDGTNDYHFIGNEPDGVVGIADYFFSVSDIAKFIRYEATEDEVFDYYDYSMKTEGKPEVNLVNWLKFRRDKNPQT